MVVWSMMAGWLASKDQSIISSRETLPFALCAIFEVELHPVTMSDSPTRAYSVAMINLVPRERVDIAVLLCRMGEKLQAGDGACESVVTRSLSPSASWRAPASRRALPR